jgi:hypothetical protein
VHLVCTYHNSFFMSQQHYFQNGGVCFNQVHVRGRAMSASGSMIGINDSAVPCSTKPD